MAISEQERHSRTAHLEIALGHADRSGPRHRRRGTGPGSDIDVLYSLLPGRKLGWEIEQLADELGSLPGHHVDLVSLRALPPPATSQLPPFASRPEAASGSVISRAT